MSTYRISTGSPTVGLPRLQPLLLVYAWLVRHVACGKR